MRPAIACQTRQSSASAANTCQRGFDLEAASLCHLAGDKREIPASNIKQGWVRPPAVRKFLERHACAVRQVKDRTVNKANADLATGRGLNYVALENKIADFEFETNATRPRDGGCTDHPLDLANGKLRRCWFGNERTSRTTLPVGATVRAAP